MSASRLTAFQCSAPVKSSVCPGSNAANAAESASAAEEMSAQTEALKDAVVELLALVNGHGASPSRHATTAASHRPVQPAATHAAKTIRTMTGKPTRQALSRGAEEETFADITPNHRGQSQGFFESSDRHV